MSYHKHLRAATDCYNKYITNKLYKRPSMGSSHSKKITEASLKLLKSECLAEAEKFFHLTEKNPKHKLAKEYVKEILKINIEKDPDASEKLETLRKEFQKKIHPNPEVLSQVVVRALIQLSTAQDAISLSRVDTRTAAHSTPEFLIRAKKELQRPIATNFLIEHWLASLAGVETFPTMKEDKGDSKQAVGVTKENIANSKAVDLLKDFQNDDIKKIYKYYRRLMHYGLPTLNQTQLILLSNNKKNIQEWVEKNKHRLYEPLDLDLGFCALHYLALTNQKDILKKLHKEKFQLIDLPDFRYFTLLNIATLGGAFDVVRLLIEIGQSLYSKSNKATIADYAALSGDVDTYENALTLTKASRTIDSSNYKDVFFNFRNAAASGSLPLLKHIWERIKNYPKRPYIAWDIARSGSIAAAELCIKEFKLDLTKAGDNLEVFPHHAVCSPENGMQMLNFAIDKLKFDPNVTDGSGYGILEHCAMAGSSETFQQLLDEYKAGNVNYPTDIAELHLFAALNGNIDVLRTCLESGANPNFTNRQLKDIFSYALRGGNIGTILICQLLGFDYDNSRAADVSKARIEMALTLTKLMSEFPMTKKFDVDFETKWNAKDSLAEKVYNVLETYTFKPKPSYFAKDPVPYRAEAELLKKRLQNFKGNDAELFLILNFTLLNWLKRTNMTTVDSFVKLIRLSTNYVLREIREKQHKLKSTHRFV